MKIRVVFLLAAVFVMFFASTATVVASNETEPLSKIKTVLVDSVPDHSVSPKKSTQSVCEIKVAIYENLVHAYTTAGAFYANVDGKEVSAVKTVNFRFDGWVLDTQSDNDLQFYTEDGIAIPEECVSYSQISANFVPDWSYVQTNNFLVVNRGYPIGDVTKIADWLYNDSALRFNCTENGYALANAAASQFLATEKEFDPYAISLTVYDRNAVPDCK